ncbi:MAG: class I SAM-dependent methyltransferase [Gammaproteobacteria bacterium]|nr:class I SAM-dependent methyltransferase [Gammaproteobacteria bacterium]
MFLGKCPSCGGIKRKRWYRHDHLQLWICDNCGLGYSDPQPIDLVEDRYLSGYDLAGYFEALEARKGVLNERRLDRLPRPREGQTLLDVGCGDGQFAAAAMSRGWSASGIELNPPAAEKAQARGIAAHQGHVEDVDLGGSTFDLVTSWDVIEHVPNPRLFIEKLVSFVAPGGTIVVTTLNRRSLVSRVFRGRWTMIVDDHYTYWDQRSLHDAFSTAGIAIAETTSYGVGRDFVTWVDRWRGSAKNRADPDGITPQTSSASAQWDVNPVVLAAENATNLVLDKLSLGVEIEVVLRAPR